MKTEVILILIFALINLTCGQRCFKWGKVTQLSDCDPLSSDEKKEGYDTCCYVSYTNYGNNIKFCTPLKNHL